MRKGQMHVLDAAAAIIIILFFALTNISMGEAPDWQNYQNQVAVRDLGYTLKKTGYLEDSLLKGETGTIKTMVEEITARDLGISGTVRGMPPNIKAGFYTPPSEINLTSLTLARTSSPCASSLGKISKMSEAPILASKSSARGKRLYLGGLEESGGYTSALDYDLMWMDDGSCSFPNASNPIERGDIFQWGGEYYEFMEVSSLNTAGSNWNGELKLAEAGQMKRFQETMKIPSGDVENKVEIDAFNFNDGVQEIKEFESLIIRGDRGLTEMSSPSNDRKVEAASERPLLFLVNLTETEFTNSYLDDNGFEWFRPDISGRYVKSNGKYIEEGYNLSVMFSGSGNSQDLKHHMLDMETYLSHLSLYPSGPLYIEKKGIASSRKILSLTDYSYGDIGKDVFPIVHGYYYDDKLEYLTSVPSGVNTACNDHYWEKDVGFSYKYKPGEEKIDIYNIEMGKTSTYCSNHNVRAFYLDRNDDGDVEDDREGPFMENERVTVNNITYNVRFPEYTRSAGKFSVSCSPERCIRLQSLESGRLSTFTYNVEASIGRAGYEKRYSEADRKALASFLYVLKGSSSIPSLEEGDVSSEFYGVIGNEAYHVRLRWSN